jgi:hypothetical protein
MNKNDQSLQSDLLEATTEIIGKMTRVACKWFSYLNGDTNFTPQYEMIIGKNHEGGR